MCKGCSWNAENDRRGVGGFVQVALTTVQLIPHGLGVKDGSQSVPQQLQAFMLIAGTDWVPTMAYLLVLVSME